MTRRVFQLKVTAEDIEIGNPGMPSLCPIARALNRKFPDRVIAVGITDVWMDEIRYDLSMSARKFIEVFDRIGKTAVVPRTFVLKEMYNEQA